MAASRGLANHYVIGDSFADLMSLWESIIEHPEKTAQAYEQIWVGHESADIGYFNYIRSSYNEDRDPIKLLYLIARCVKNAVRFNRHGHFTQSVDKRRLGMHPAKMRANIQQASNLLNGRVTLRVGDFKDCITDAAPGDLVYMDPPYQGTTYGRDKRYYAGLERDKLADALRSLNSRNVPFLLSYDGMLGGVEYGESLPLDIEARRIFLNAGRSSQATLMGKDSVTVESLYMSANLSPVHDSQLPARQTALLV
jgi:DNA adenine methylase